MLRTHTHTLLLALVIFFSMPASAALGAPPEERSQAVYDQVFMQRAAQIKNSQELQRKRALQFAEQDERVLVLRGDAGKPIEDDMPVMGIDAAESFSQSYGASIMTAIAAAVVIGFTSLLMDSRRVGAMLKEERLRRRQRRNASGLGAVLDNLDQKIADNSITRRIKSVSRRSSSPPLVKRRIIRRASREFLGTPDYFANFRVRLHKTAGTVA
jgi:hypothetical protein